MFDRDNPAVLSCLQSMMMSTDAAAIDASVGELVGLLGYGGYAFGLMWGAEAMPEGMLSLSGGNMTAYAAEYFQNNFAGADPVIRRLRISHEPVLWGPFIADPRLGGPDSRMAEIVACMRRHDIHAGVSIPADIDAVGCRAGLSVSAQSGVDAARFETRFAENGWVLRLAALALAHLLGHESAREASGSLSTSERLVLVALSQGLRPRDIADRLGKSEHTIRNQIVSAQQRLGARTKEEAIAKALRFGLIQL